MKKSKIRVPENLTDLDDLLSAMRLSAPKFESLTGSLRFINLDYRFRQLHAGLDHNRARLGDARYFELKHMADEMRPLFEADPDDKTGQTHQGCMIILAMEDILRQAKRKS